LFKSFTDVVPRSGSFPEFISGAAPESARPPKECRAVVTEVHGAELCSPPFLWS
jgi:hypothetical protein